MWLQLMSASVAPRKDLAWCHVMSSSPCIQANHVMGWDPTPQQNKALAQHRADKLIGCWLRKRMTQQLWLNTLSTWTVCVNSHLIYIVPFCQNNIACVYLGLCSSAGLTSFQNCKLNVKELWKLSSCFPKIQFLRALIKCETTSRARW